MDQKKQRSELARQKREQMKQENPVLYKAKQEALNLKARQKRMQDKLDDLNRFLENNKSILYI